MLEPHHLVTPNNLVFDVGANNGNQTQVFADAGAFVVAFEANPLLSAYLTNRFANTPNVLVENKALAGKCGVITLEICSETPTLSTCNPAWTSGRFKNKVWDETAYVPATTLDKAMTFFGVPDFIKIDVEGFEFQVLSGLNRPVKLVSFEFTIEFYDNMVACLDHLSSLGMNQFNIGLGEHTSLHLPRWVSSTSIKEIISDLGKDNADLWGDIYARQG